MAELILRDADEALVGQRIIAADEYLRICQLSLDAEYLEHAGKRYRVLTIAWDRTTEQCNCRVRDEGYVPVTYADD